MPKLRVHNFSLSLDGYAAGPNQSIEHPLGVGGQELHEWRFVTPAFHQQGNVDEGTADLDTRFAARGNSGIGATIMGRNMFGPVRGPWGDEHWRGWWGDDPPFHHPVFVLTHHPQASITMEGGTTFHFVTEGIAVALERAFAAAGGQDVQLGGGAATVQQYLRAGLVDEMHLAIVPKLLGSGERLFEHLDGGPSGYRCVEFVASAAVLHVQLVRSAANAAQP
jgi:dihydrofolate reductase